MNFWPWKKDKPIKEPEHMFRIYRNGYNKYIIRRYFMDNWWDRWPGQFDSQEDAQAYIDNWIDKQIKTNKLTLISTISYYKD